MARIQQSQVGHRGNPDGRGYLDGLPEGTIIHLYRPASVDGCYAENTVCAHGSYHVWWSPDPKLVNCPACLKIMADNVHIKNVKVYFGGSTLGILVKEVWCVNSDRYKPYGWVCQLQDLVAPHLLLDKLVKDLSDGDQKEFNLELESDGGNYQVSGARAMTGGYTVAAGEMAMQEYITLVVRKVIKLEESDDAANQHAVQV